MRGNQPCALQYATQDYYAAYRDFIACERQRNAVLVTMRENRPIALPPDDAPPAPDAVRVTCRVL
jgi:hypothetical protein